MTVRTMTWAMDHAPVTDPISLLVLYALADPAHDDGTHAFVGVAKMMHRTRRSRATVFRKLRELQDSGIIRRGNQALAADIPERYRPVVWELNIRATWDHPEEAWTEDQGSQNETPEDPGQGSHDDPSGVSENDVRGLTNEGSGVSLLRPKPTTNQEQTKNRTNYSRDAVADEAEYALIPVETPAKRTEYPEEFEAFWAVYPRRVEKIAAVKAWRAARKRVPAEVLIAAAARYRDDPNREDVYTPYPQKWLNNGGWEDGPCPPRRDMPRSEKALRTHAALRAEITGDYQQRAEIERRPW